MICCIRNKTHFTVTLSHSSIAREESQPFKRVLHCSAEPSQHCSSTTPIRCTPCAYTTLVGLMPRSARTAEHAHAQPAALRGGARASGTPRRRALNREPPPARSSARRPPCAAACGQRRRGQRAAQHVDRRGHRHGRSVLGGWHGVLRTLRTEPRARPQARWNVVCGRCGTSGQGIQGGPRARPGAVPPAVALALVRRWRCGYWQI